MNEYWSSMSHQLLYVHVIQDKQTSRAGCLGFDAFDKKVFEVDLHVTVHNHSCCLSWKVKCALIKNWDRSIKQYFFDYEEKKGGSKLAQDFISSSNLI